MASGIREAVLLCGGGSERLGFAKEMLRVDGVPLAAALVRGLRSVFEDVALVTNRPAYLEHWLSVPIWTDEFPGLGPLAGIHAGLVHCHGDGAFFLGCDMPLVREETLRRLLEEAGRSEAVAVVARTRRGPEPLCGIYRKELLPALKARLEAGEGLGAAAFLEEAGAAYVEVGSREAAGLRDIDRPEDVPLLKERFAE
ncbi:MAG: molybdenum cofactor guanylyltransferase, partial [Planctomycetota bacterium]